MSTLNPSGGASVFRQIVRNLYPHVGLSAAAVIAFVIKQTPVWALPLLAGGVVDILNEKPGDARSKLLIYAAIMAFLILQNIPLHAVFARLTSRVTRKIQLQLRAALVEQLQRLSITFHEKNSPGSLLSKVLRDVDSVDVMYRSIFHNVPNAVLLGSVALITSLLTEPWMALFFVAVVPAAVLLTQAFRHRMGRTQHDYRRVVESMSGRIINMVNLIPLTRAHGLEHLEVNSLVNDLHGVQRKAVTADTWTELFAASVWSTFQLALAGCLIFAGFLSLSDHLTVGQVVMFHGFFLMIVNAVGSVLGVLPQLLAGTDALRSINEILKAPDVEENEGKRKLTAVHGDFSFNKVTYTYPDSSHGLKEIELHVRPGESVALVGASGSGKSTLVKILLGFLRPLEGEICVDDTRYGELDLRSLRNFVSVVPQEVVLFSGTMRENITYGLSSVSEPELRAVLEQAQLSALIDELPLGLDTRLGENGIQLSGGQKQRVAIARALIRNPKVLILDEATSALDAESEQLVQDALENLLQGRTTLIVAHRLSTILMADRILVMEDGRIVEEGTYEALVKMGQRFAKMDAIYRGAQAPATVL